MAVLRCCHVVCQLSVADTHLCLAAAADLTVVVHQPLSTFRLQSADKHLTYLHVHFCDYYCVVVNIIRLHQMLTIVVSDPAVCQFLLCGRAVQKWLNGSTSYLPYKLLGTKETLC